MAAIDRVDSSWLGAGGAQNPARHATAISPHNSNELSYITRALYVGGAGDVKVTMQGGEEVTFVGVLAGTLLPIKVRKVFSTGTSATDLIGLD
jgi:hypothetical protein